MDEKYRAIVGEDRFVQGCHIKFKQSKQSYHPKEALSNEIRLSRVPFTQGVLIERVISNQLENDLKLRV